MGTGITIFGFSIGVRRRAGQIWDLGSTGTSLPRLTPEAGKHQAERNLQDERECKELAKWLSQRC